MIDAHSVQTLAPASLEVQTTASSNIQLWGEHSNEISLLHEGRLAKPISALEPSLRGKANAIQAMAPSHASLKSALLQHLLTDIPLSQIACEHSFTPAALLYWVGKLGLPHRRRGRRPLEEPTPKHRQMLKLSAELSCTEIARQFGVGRQCVHQALTRWAHLRPQRLVPAKPVTVLRSQTRRELKERLITFRLTALQMDRVAETLKSCGIGNRLSDGAACRAVLLAALGVGKLQLANSSNTTDHAGNNGKDLVIGGTTQSSNISRG